MFSVGISAAFNIILNLILIPYYSYYIGVSIATVLSELLLYCLFLFYIGRYYKTINVNRTFTEPLIASIIMAIYPIKKPEHMVLSQSFISYSSS